MKEFKPIMIDDRLLDTIGFGDVVVTDLFVSPRTGKIIYEVTNDEGEVFNTDESELQTL